MPINLDQQYIITERQLQHVKSRTRPLLAKKKSRMEWNEDFESLRLVKHKVVSDAIGARTPTKQDIFKIIELAYDLATADSYAAWIKNDCELWKRLKEMGITADDLKQEDE